ncbi:MAG: hypothetical protein ACRC33_22575 [Gemmataceae bacterium]
MDVIDAGSNKVAFQFYNTGPLAMSITQIYFDDGTLLGLASITNGGLGVDFSQDLSPGNLPGGNPINFNETFEASSNPPTQPNGVNPGETLTITFDLVVGQTYADTLAAIALDLANPGVGMPGGLRIGMHVQGFANGGSEAFVNGGPPTAVPVPAGIVLLASGVPVLSLGRFLGRRKTAA